VRCRTAAGPIPRLWEPLAAKHRPKNGYAAKFKPAVPARLDPGHGRATLADFTDEAVRDETLRGVAARSTTISTRHRLPRHFIGHVAVALTDGRVLEERAGSPARGARCPDDREELTAKFRANAAEHSEAQASRVVALVDALAAQPRLAP